MLASFTTKVSYLVDRHAQLRNEMTRRGYKVNYELDLSSWPESAMGSWQPDADSQIINVSRIINRTKK